MLETPGMAFKLFLWDRIETDAREFSRPDRIKTYTLKWTAPQLKTMLSRRLAAHSGQKVLSLAAITELGRSADIDELVVSLSGGSHSEHYSHMQGYLRSAERVEFPE
jgi:hypothetical protein